MPLRETATLRRHEPLGLHYLWPPTAGDAHRASLTPHPIADLMRQLAVDSEGNAVWGTWEELAGEVSPNDVALWGSESGADKHFTEPEPDEVDVKRQARIQERMGELGPVNEEAVVDAKAWGRLSSFQRMVAQLSLAYHLDPHSLMENCDYVLLRGMLAKASMDGRAARAKAGK